MSRSTQTNLPVLDLALREGRYCILHARLSLDAPQLDRLIVGEGGEEERDTAASLGACIVM
jgi:hypothetical protein